MHLNNVGIRKIARFIGVSPAFNSKMGEVFRARLSEQIKKASEGIRENHLDIIEMDEIYL